MHTIANSKGYYQADGDELGLGAHFEVVMCWPKLTFGITVASWPCPSVPANGAHLARMERIRSSYGARHGTPATPDSANSRQGDANTPHHSSSRVPLTSIYAFKCATQAPLFTKYKSILPHVLLVHEQGDVSMTST